MRRTISTVVRDLAVKVGSVPAARWVWWDMRKWSADLFQHSFHHGWFQARKFPGGIFAGNRRFGGLIRIEKVHQRHRERRQVLRRAAGDEVAVNDDWFVHPDRAGIFQVVLDARRTSGAFAVQDSRR